SSIYLKNETTKRTRPRRINERTGQYRVFYNTYNTFPSSCSSSLPGPCQRIFCALRKTIDGRAPMPSSANKIPMMREVWFVRLRRSIYNLSQNYVKHSCRRYVVAHCGNCDLLER